jgi:hypothetical protein
MTPEAQRIAIAEACGWKKGIHAGDWWLPGDDMVHAESEVPQYPSDLNAMHEAEKTRTAMQKVKFVLTLAELRNSPGCLALADCIFATSSQRAEAFLRTIGKWDDSK